MDIPLSQVNMSETGLKSLLISGIGPFSVKCVVKYLLCGAVFYFLSYLLSNFLDPNTQIISL